MIARPKKSASRTLEGSFAEFYRREADRLLLWFSKRTLDTEAAADLTSETFAHAFIGRKRFRGSDEDRIAWLYGIARNQLKRYWRSGATESRAMRRLGLERIRLEPSEEQKLEERANLLGLRQHLGQALSTLSARQREAVSLRFIDEMSYADIAGLLKISEPTARARVSRALRSLASQLDLITAENSKEATTC